MKTLDQKADEEEERSSNSTEVVSFPTDIVEDIVSRLPVRSILRSGSVSKPWLNLISGSPFTKLQFTRATESHRTGLFFSAFDYDTKKRYYLTASKDGGPLTLLMTFDDGVGNIDMTGPSHLNGLMCFTSMTWTKTWKGIQSLALLVNPATRKVFKLPDMNSPSDEYHLLGYLYGFDESRNDHKILSIRKVFKTNKYEFMVFSMSTLLWRKIDAEPPVGFDWDCLRGGFGAGVCLNSVVHLMVGNLSFDILAFDFIKEKFSFISFPQGFLPEDHGEVNEEGLRKVYIPSLTNISGCLGVFLHDRERSEVRVWLLQDYDNRVWVKETIKLSMYLNDLAGGYPLSINVNMDDEIVFSMSKWTENVITIPIYNMKTKCFKSVHFTFDGQFASSKSVSFCSISCYLETIMPLVDNWSKTSHGESD